MLLTFPNYNFFSTSLLLLILQGTIFALLLANRFRGGRHISDLFLAILLIITGYHRTTFIIGFMDWYDTFRNTKINYWLINFSLAIGPLIYFYIKSVTEPYFKFQKKNFWHFAPAIFMAIYKIGYFIFDAQQPGFDEVQNGWFSTNIHWEYFSTPISVLTHISYLIYFYFSIKLLKTYEKRVGEYFSNTYEVELRWLYVFVYIFAFLYIFQLFLDIFEFSFFQNQWKQLFWGHFAGACIMIYVGMMSWFSDLSKLYFLEPPTESLPPSDEKPVEVLTFEKEKSELLNFMDSQKPFLNPEITLPEMAKKLKLSTNQLSQILNSGFGKNFNEFINEFRVEMVKEKMVDPENSHLSLLGIAFESGFNSKATFNRVFKKVTGVSPSQFLKGK